MAWVCNKCGKSNMDAVKYCLNCSSPNQMVPPVLTADQPEKTPDTYKSDEPENKDIPNNLEQTPDEVTVDVSADDDVQDEESSHRNDAEALYHLTEDTDLQPSILATPLPSDVSDISVATPRKTDLSVIKYILTIGLLTILLIYTATKLQHNKTIPAPITKPENNFLVSGNPIVNVLPKRTSPQVSPSANTKAPTESLSVTQNQRNKALTAGVSMLELYKTSLLNFYQKENIISQQELQLLTTAIIKSDMESQTIQSIIKKITTSDYYLYHSAKIYRSKNDKANADLALKNLKEKFPASPLNKKSATLEKQNK